MQDVTLREFILRTVNSVPRDARPVDLVEFSLSNLSSTLILREHRNFDIFAVNDEENFVVVIENKIRSKKHSNQLQRYRQYVENQYPDYQEIYAYLTPDGEEPSDSSYIPYSYSEIALLIEQVANEAQKIIPAPVASVLGQYLESKRTVHQVSPIPNRNRIPPFVRVGSCVRVQRQPESGLECAAQPTFTALALLHLKRRDAPNNWPISNRCGGQYYSGIDTEAIPETNNREFTVH
jgi:hypothetical protein